MKNKIINHKKNNTNQIESFKNETLYDYVLKNAKKWNGWDKFFLKEDVKETLKKISHFLVDEIEKKNYTIAPTLDKIFTCFKLTSPSTLKAFISGQDPPPEPHLANGLAFSVLGVDTSHEPSTQRVLLELNNDGFKCDPLDGDTRKWASQGVMMYDDAKTIPFAPGAKLGIIGAHVEIWKDFSRKLFEFIDEELSQPFVFILWGEKAHRNEQYIKRSNHIAITGGHPSPAANGKYFFCRNYFSKTNKFLKENGSKEIDWNIKPNYSKYKKGIYAWEHKTKTSKWINYCNEYEE